MKLLTLLCSTVFSSALYASQTVTPCGDVLKQSSQEWIALYTKEHGDNVLEQVKAILQYSTCFDQQLQKRKANLDGSGNGPLMGAMGNYRDLESALKDFTSTAIRACGQSGDRVRVQRAYASLYQLQFTDYFYLQYENPKKIPATDTNEVKRQQQVLEAQMNKADPDDAKLLRDRFKTLVEAAEEVGIPLQNIYSYAVMVTCKEGNIIQGKVPF